MRASAVSGPCAAPSCSYSVPPKALLYNATRRLTSRSARLKAATKAQYHQNVFAAAVGQELPLRPLSLPIEPIVDSYPDSEPFSIDVLGIGQAMVDINAMASEELLSKLDVSRGGRRVLQSIEERSDVLQTIDDEECTTQLSAGGSLANSLFAIGQLGGAASTHPHSRRRLAVCMSGCCSNDHLGQFFASQMHRGGVIVDSSASGPTGTVMVLTDPSGERSFLSYFGESNDTLQLQAPLRRAITQSKVVVIEGYLWEMPGALAAIREIIHLAREAGSQVALTAGDPGVVSRHRAELLEVLGLGVDFLFCNVEEARQLLQDNTTGASDAAAKLGSLVQAAVVTAGSEGSFVGFMGHVHDIPPVQMAPGAVTSTNGAGDAFCGGFLFALSHGHGVTESGKFASRAAAAVIARHGAQLEMEDAESLVAEHLPAHPELNLSSATMLEAMSGLLP